ncbi:MAG TPA: PIN domain nuclease [Vitreimonas sp.]|uniref:type II toxin-antitoxin system VapC family toxin n=1 Tax=Vitreimonas sp. TaxID=3069702 RepID=UPI002D6F9D63|nr:PIN domain nuclease [Vitreimonas sp.]HYD87358.1 PIN domain nuclease [Vitreimonas sp.]
MIVVDSSVWIAHFRNEVSPAVAVLRGLQKPTAVVTGDLVLLECLQGARDDKHAAQIEATLRAFTVEPMLNDTHAADGARLYRRLRALGVTPRKMTDFIIATFCIARGYRLLHQDRDFEPMVQHLGLQVVV